MAKTTLHSLWKIASELMAGQKPPRTPRKKTSPKVQLPPSLLIFPEQDGLPALPFLLVRDQYRTMRITVRRDGTVQVKVPFYAKDSDALRAVAQKRAWIEGKRTAFHQRPALPPHHYRDGDVFYYLGRPFTLLLCETPPFIGAKAQKLQARLRGTNLVVTGDDLNPERVQKAIDTWRNKIGQTFFSKRLPRLHAWSCRIIGDDIPLPDWKLRALKRRWGSCARRRERRAPHLSTETATRHEITLARHLTAVPLPYIDYVILHELCHMRHMDHSPRFYGLLHSLMPEAPQLSRQLDDWGLEHSRD